MARGNSIIVTDEPMGQRFEGTIEGTPKPGTCMMVKAGTAMDGNGHFTYEAFSFGADGHRAPIIILLENYGLGKDVLTAYANGDHGFLYTPLPGDHLNVLKGDVSGTADDFTVGQLLIIDDTTGKVIGTTGSPESEPFQCLEAITDPTADQLVFVKYTGY